MRIAEILCEHFRKHDDAIAEVRAAMAKDPKPDLWVRLANRLADIYIERFQNFDQARAILLQIIDRFPNSKYAKAAHVRVLSLKDRQTRDGQAKSPRRSLKVPH